MFFRTHDENNHRAWGNPNNERLSKAVTRLRVANHWSTTLVSVGAGVCAVLSIILGVISFVANTAGGAILFTLSLAAVFGAAAAYLNRGQKQAKKTVEDAKANGNAILACSDAYRLLEVSLYRTYRLDLLDLLTGAGSEHYNGVMLAYIKAAWPFEVELDEARDRRGQLAAHKRLVVAAESVAGSIAQIHLDENAIEV